MPYGVKGVHLRQCPSHAENQHGRDENYKAWTEPELQLICVVSWLKPSFGVANAFARLCSQVHTVWDAVLHCTRDYHRLLQREGGRLGDRCLRVHLAHREAAVLRPGDARGDAQDQAGEARLREDHGRGSTCRAERGLLEISLLGVLRGGIFGFHTF